MKVPVRKLTHNMRRARASRSSNEETPPLAPTQHDLTPPSWTNRSWWLTKASVDRIAAGQWLFLTFFKIA
jgi:hypothetical protein